MQRTMKVISAIMALLFLVAVAVQYNDPDPLLWMAFYLSVAVISITAAAGRFHWQSALAALLVALGWGLYLSPAFAEATKASFSTFSMHGRDEVAREAGGLLFAAAWMAALAVYGWRRQKASASATR